MGTGIGHAPDAGGGVLEADPVADLAVMAHVDDLHVAFAARLEGGGVVDIARQNLFCTLDDRPARMEEARRRRGCGDLLERSGLAVDVGAGDLLAFLDEGVEIVGHDGLRSASLAAAIIFDRSGGSCNTRVRTHSVGF